MKIIWILNFEYQGIAKVGGLGEVSANQTRKLSNSFDFLVLMPSHGQIERLKEVTSVEKLSFNCKGKQDFTFNKKEIKHQEYDITFYQLCLNNVKLILFSGENDFTRKYLDDEIVYNPDTFDGKVCLYSLGMRHYVKHVIETNEIELPDIIHIHDYHAVIPFIAVKQELTKNHFDVSSIITFHLLTWPRYDLEFYRTCGIGDTPFNVLFKNGPKNLTLLEIWNILEDKTGKKEKSLPSIEQVGAIASDLVITVSESYLKSDIIPNLGGELISFKTDFVWNGCDWDYYEIQQNVMENLGKEIRSIMKISEDKPITRSDMKRYLLTYKIGNIKESPLIKSKRVLEIINEISNGNPFIKNGNIKSFSDTGPLLISTGRISKQKGFETIFEAIPLVVKKIPNAKFLLLILPTEYSLKEIKLYTEYVKEFPNNLRILFGIAPDIFNLAHISADVYAALSRWEPFGIIALEAMASKLPVIATRIGGLRESIIDIRENTKKGTGLLIPREQEQEFADALILFFKLSQISELSRQGKSVEMIKKDINLDKIYDNNLMNYLMENPRYYDEIRQNCYERVENHFRWSIVSEKLKRLYQHLSKEIQT